jgi:hypothetical protein
MGGTIDPDMNWPSNLLVVCTTCHSSIESRREVAYGNGWLCHNWTAAADAPALLWDGWWYLEDDYGRTLCLTASGKTPEAAPGRPGPAGGGC